MESQVRSELTSFIVTNYLFGDVEKVPASDESLVEGGVIDSTGILELIEFLESQFDIEISEEETVPENLDSITRMTNFVLSKKALLEAV